jgi:hypothetical protein
MWAVLVHCWIGGQLLTLRMCVTHYVCVVVVHGLQHLHLCATLSVPTQSHDCSGLQAKGDTPLHFASRLGELACLRALLDRGADIHQAAVRV